VTYSKTTLVTGASGFIGRELLRQLLAQNVRVRATDLLSTNQAALNASNFEFIEADITKPEQLAQLFDDVDRVFHIAGICNLTSPFNKLEPVNVAAAGMVAEMARARKVACFVHFSSTSIYGTYKGSPFAETSPCSPKDNYGKSKLLGENMIRDNIKNGLPAIILRPCTVYGPGCNDGAGKVFSRPSTIAGIPGNGRQKLANIRVEDVASAALFLSEVEAAIGGTFNLADNSQPQLEEALVAASKAFGSKLSRTHIPLRLMKALAWLEGSIAKQRNKIPNLELEAIKYLYNDYIVDNSQLLAQGYQLKYPDFHASMQDMATRIKNEDLLCHKPS
jgi:nucleoside-diphosphate-sugar epimerase